MSLTVPARLLGWVCLLALAAVVLVEPTFAQARNPFSVGISEGGGSATGITGWLLAQQGWLEQQLSLGVRATRLGSTTALWGLVGMSFVYGVFHAAGPGHGKAVLGSYMVANERALRRGIALSFAAALLQGSVAIALVGVMTLVLHATADRMKHAASLVEMTSFLAIVALGLLLVWRKGQALRRSWTINREQGWPTASRGLPFEPSMAAFAMPAGPAASAFRSGAAMPPARFTCDDASSQTHAADCLHCHAIDPRSLGDTSFAWRSAAATVLAAGLRPCSGAILVLVFAFAQGVFGTGVLSVLAMSIGVAVTTAALATMAVAFKGMAMRLAGRTSPRGMVIAAALEFVAACVVLAAGILLLAGYAAVIGGP